MHKLLSRKFLLSLGAVLVTVGSALQEQITWEKAITAIAITVVGYVFAEAFVDGKAASTVPFPPQPPETSSNSSPQ